MSASSNPSGQAKTAKSSDRCRWRLGTLASNYGYTLTLLVIPEAEKRWRRRDEDEEPVEDSYDRFISRGQLQY